MTKIIEPYRIEIPLGVMFHTVNCYLVPGEKLTLIDCGLESEENWKILQDEVKAHGYQVSDIEQVIITHEHRDHIGLLLEIIDVANPIVRAPESIKKWFTSPSEIKEVEFNFLKKLYQKSGFPGDILGSTLQFLSIAWNARKINNMSRFEYFEEGDILSFGMTEWEVLNTPGHCPTQYVFLNKEQSRIFGSDMLLPIAPMPIVVEDPKNKDQPIRALPDLLRSFDRLKEYDLKTVYPGHGEIFQDANKVIEKQLARIKVRKEECFEAIKAGSNTPYLINRKMYPYQQMPPDFSGMHMVFGYIDLLIEEGRINIDLEILNS